MEHEATRLLAQDYLHELAHWPAQAVVLGCTHYPLLTPLLTQLLGPDVRIIDSASAVAQAVSRALDETGLRTSDPQPGDKRLALYATDVTPRTKKIATRFLQDGATVVERVDL
jgi:glutamate racemase